MVIAHKFLRLVQFISTSHILGLVVGRIIVDWNHADIFLPIFVEFVGLLLNVLLTADILSVSNLMILTKVE